MTDTWQKPVQIALEEPGQYTTIASTTAASWAMIEDWPVDEAPLLTRALEICTAILEGKRHVGDAREAFIAAAREAGLDIRD